MAITAVRKQSADEECEGVEERWENESESSKLYSTTRSIHVHVGGVCKERGFQCPYDVTRGVGE